MTFTGKKSSETILGLHACRFDKLENFGITFWKKPTFTMLQKLGHAKVGNKIDKLNKGYKVAYLTLTNYW